MSHLQFSDISTLIISKIKDAIKINLGKGVMITHELM